MVHAEGGRALASSRGQSQAQTVATVLATRGRDARTMAATRQVEARVGRNGVTHVRLEQNVDGLSVYGAYAKAAFDRNGDLVHLIDHLAPVSNVSLPAAKVDAAQALTSVVKSLHPSAPNAFSRQNANADTVTFSASQYFWSSPTVKAVAVPLDDGTMTRGWLVQTWSRGDNQLHYTLVSASDGRILHVESRTNSDSYNVFAKSPLQGGQSTVTGPGAGNAVSPSGWLSGAQTTINIKGNNASAYLDADASNTPDAGGQAVSGGNFLTGADLAAAPSTTGNRAVAVQNLFYLSNVMHDVLYAYGFNEENGNFQVNNFAKGGSGNDPVLAEAQDGSGTDNANFATPNDGQSPRMQMYLWTGDAPSGFVRVSTTDYGLYSSSFGPVLPQSGTPAPLALYNDGTGVSSDACEVSTVSLAGKIAVVDRGACDFTVKVLNAQKAGAVAVVIVNNVPGKASAPGGTSGKVRISSGMVSAADGAAIKAAVNQQAALRKNSVVPLQIDGDIDSDIVFHEYGHGLTWRMIGGMSGPLAGAIGEGASDVNAFLMNKDDIMGEYAFSNPAGIRRYPYNGYPLTYKSVTGAEVHDDGEIYAGAMWRVLVQYRSLGLTEEALHADFVNGMNYTPATPTFENMRDGMLQAVAGSGRECLIWRGFAGSGIGVGAKGVVGRRGAVTITESFALPANCQ
ncbi:M36 family metallopeptidase [Rhizobacter sp. Root404]|uniref:M36 family metallopeptidase n=1 Tax=Rhizobacter sp. Root404 TaxID=1736528 RepID=UPI00138F60BE|nr:M36 family metallopeptidase [Rhizobacter sp. Root404]